MRRSSSGPTTGGGDARRPGRERDHVPVTRTWRQRRSAIRPGSRTRGRKQMDACQPGFTPAGDHQLPKHVVDLANQLMKAPRHLGIHSGGMVLTEEPVSYACPVDAARWTDRTARLVRRDVARRTVSPSSWDPPPGVGHRPSGRDLLRAPTRPRSVAQDDMALPSSSQPFCLRAAGYYWTSERRWSREIRQVGRSDHHSRPEIPYHKGLSDSHGRLITITSSPTQPSR